MPDKMIIIKKAKNNKFWSGCREKTTLVCYCWKFKLVQPLWKAVWRLLKKLRTELTHDPVIPLLGIHPRKTKTVT